MLVEFEVKMPCIEWYKHINYWTCSLKWHRRKGGWVGRWEISGSWLMLFYISIMTNARVQSLVSIHLSVDHLLPSGESGKLTTIVLVVSLLISSSPDASILPPASLHRSTPPTTLTEKKKNDASFSIVANQPMLKVVSVYYQRTWFVYFVIFSCLWCSMLMFFRCKCNLMLMIFLI